MRPALYRADIGQQCKFAPAMDDLLAQRRTGKVADDLEQQIKSLEERLGYRKVEEPKVLPPLSESKPN